MPYGLSDFFSSSPPVPGPRGWFEALSFLTFTAHILFMNAVLGTLLITFFRSLVPGTSLTPVTDESEGALPVLTPLANPTINATLSENISILPKALAITVNLGVAPLLFIQVGYGQFFYSSAIIQGMWWLGVMLLVMMSYYGLYLYPAQHKKGVRTLILGLCSGMLLLTALTLTSNAALVLNPQLWPNWLPDRGSALFLTGVWVVLPRLTHTLFATFAIGGLCLAISGEIRRKKGLLNQELSVDEGLTWFKYATIGQFVMGIWYFLSLTSPQQSILMNSPVTQILFFCIFAGIFLALWFAAHNQTWRTAACAILIISLMIAVRAFLRHSTLLPDANSLPQEFTTAPSVLITFILSLLGSLLVIIWMLRLAQKASAKNNDESAPSGDRISGAHTSTVQASEIKTSDADASGEAQS